MQFTTNPAKMQSPAAEPSEHLTGSDPENLLVPHFPSSLTKDMSRRANSAGIWLEIRLIIAFRTTRLRMNFFL